MARWPFADFHLAASSLALIGNVSARASRGEDGALIAETFSIRRQEGSRWRLGGIKRGVLFQARPGRAAIHPRAAPPRGEARQSRTPELASPQRRRGRRAGTRADPADWIAETRSRAESARTSARTDGSRRANAGRLRFPGYDFQTSRAGFEAGLIEKPPRAWPSGAALSSPERRRQSLPSCGRRHCAGHKMPLGLNLTGDGRRICQGHFEGCGPGTCPTAYRPGSNRDQSVTSLPIATQVPTSSSPP